MSADDPKASKEVQAELAAAYAVLLPQAHALVEVMLTAAVGALGSRVTVDAGPVWCLFMRVQSGRLDDAIQLLLSHEKKTRLVCWA